MSEQSSKLNYRIVGRRVIEGDMFNMDYVDVEWTHTDGFPPDEVEHALRENDLRVVMENLIKHATERGIISSEVASKLVALESEIFRSHTYNKGMKVVTVVTGERKVLKDQLCVPRACKDAVIMQMCEDKREDLARALGVQP